MGAGVKNPILYSIGDIMTEQAGGNGHTKKNSTKIPGWRKALETAETYPEDIRDNAFIALTIYQYFRLIAYAGHSLVPDKNEIQHQKNLAPHHLKSRRLANGIVNWEDNSQKDRSETCTILKEFITNEKFSTSSRCQLAFSAVQHRHEFLEDSTIAAAVADLYEIYCAGERSALNEISSRVQTSSSRLENFEPVHESLKRINSVFWKNVESPKTGGHPLLNPHFDFTFFLADARSEDSIRAKTSLAVCRPQILSSLRGTSYLINANLLDYAEQYLPNPNEPTVRSDNFEPKFTPQLEARFEEFSKRKINSTQLLVLRSHFLTLQSSEPKKSLEQRTAELVADYTANPPTSLVANRQILDNISKLNHKNLISFRDKLNAACIGIDFKEDYNAYVDLRGDESLYNLAERSAALRQDLYRTTSLVNFSQGDPTMLLEVIKTIIQVPESQYSSGTNAGRRIEYGLLNNIAAWAMVATVEGNLDAFEKILPGLESIILHPHDSIQPDSGLTYKTCVFHRHIALAIGKPELTQAFIDKVTTDGNKDDYTENKGLLPFLHVARSSGIWDNSSFKETRKEFLLSAFSDPAFSITYSSRNAGSLLGSRLYRIDDELLALSDPMPESILPEVRPILAYVQGRILQTRREPKKAVKSFKYCLSQIHDPTEWKALTALAHVDLASNLVKIGQAQEAIQTFNSFKKADLPKNRMRVYERTQKQINEALKK